MFVSSWSGPDLEVTTRHEFSHFRTDISTPYLVFVPFGLTLRGKARILIEDERGHWKNDIKSLTGGVLNGPPGAQRRQADEFGGGTC